MKTITNSVKNTRYISGRITSVTHYKHRFYGIPWIGKEIQYRIPKAVRQICVFPSRDAYSICPRCDCLLDREYMNFCDRCGQKLSWRLFRFATIVYAPRKK